uniref:ZNF646-like protein n=1 Tax=Pantodon buchholzi TaxID=8276 RepID=A0A088FS87_PANBU|nr:ZNF646-like protein [Pantodon buchholzi]
MVGIWLLRRRFQYVGTLFRRKWRVNSADYSVYAFYSALMCFIEVARYDVATRVAAHLLPPSVRMLIFHFILLNCSEDLLRLDRSHISKTCQTMHDFGEHKGILNKQCDTVYSNSMPSMDYTSTQGQEEEGGKFRCEQCGRRYRHAGSLANHKKTHDVGAFQCPIKNFQCPICGKAFRLASQLATHKRVHKSLSSSGEHGNMDQMKGESSRSKAHEQDGANAEPMSAQSFCLVDDIQDIDESGSDPNSSPESFKKSDPGGSTGRPFQCDQCDRTYRHHGSLINHKKCHKLGAFECNVCFKQYNNLAGLMNHQRTHTKSRLRSHTQTSRSSQKATPEEPVSQNEDTTACYCHLCEVAFSNNADFQEHIMLHNIGSLPENLSDNFSACMSDTRPMVPSQSDDSPLTLNRQDRHSLESTIDRQIYSCAYCGEGFSDLDILKDHYLTHDSQNSSNSHEDDLVPHVEDQSADSQPMISESPKDEKVSQSSNGNAKERRFSCQVCGKSYRHAGSLVNHKRSHQTGSYQCTVCCKYYPHLAALNNHLRTHRARPPSMPHSTEGDWLSPEPLTMDIQHSYMQTHEQEVEEASRLSLLENLEEASRCFSDSTRCETLGDVAEQYDTSVAQDIGDHSQLLQRDHPVERHMCADCGETYTDIAGIKSHICPQRSRYQEGNGFLTSMTFGGLGDEPLQMGQGEVMGTRKRSQAQALMHGRDWLNRATSQEHHHDGKEVETEDDDGEMYHCSVCGNRYTSLDALRTHLSSNTHSQGTPTSTDLSSLSSLGEEENWRRSQEVECSLMICSTCGESFAREQDLQAHQLLHQVEEPIKSSPGPTKGKIEEKSPICENCGVMCSDYNDLESHQCMSMGKEGHICESGEMKVENHGSLRSSLERLDHGDRPHQCDQCGRSYRHPSSLINHKKSHKTGVFRCFVCQKRFFNLLALKSHHRTHFDKKRHSCEKCGKAFKIQKQLINHLQSHEKNQTRLRKLTPQLHTFMQANEGEYSVDSLQGTAGVPKRRNAKARGSQNMRDVSQAMQGYSGDLIGEARPYSCDQCGRTYRHAGSLLNHKKLHKIGKFVCSVCNSTYSTQLDLKNHFRMHFAFNKYDCQESGRATQGPKQLLAQKCSGNNSQGGRRRRESSECSGLECSLCRETFSTMEQQAAHRCSDNFSTTSDFSDSHQDGVGKDKVLSPQTSERPFVCTICNRTYRHAGSLLNHKNTHKTGNFSCSFCSKPFSNAMALRNHTRIHTQKKKHICTTCGKAFRLASILTNHQKLPCMQQDIPRQIWPQEAPLPEEPGDQREGWQEDEQCEDKRGGGDTLHLVSHNGVAGGLSEPILEGDQPAAEDMAAHARTQIHAHAQTDKHRLTCIQTPTGSLSTLINLNGIFGLRGKPEHPEKTPQQHGENPQTPHTWCPAGAALEPLTPEVCDQCGRSYRHASSLLNHKNTHTIGIYHCALCLKTFSNLLALKNHRRIHSEVRRHSCPDCNKTFRVSSQLRSHRRVHLKQLELTCHSCQRSFPSRISFRKHQELHTQNSTRGLDMTWTSGLDLTLMQAQGLDPSGLPKLASVWPKEQEDGADQKVYACEHCGRSYRHASSLLNHKNSHKTGSFVCPTCHKEFSNLMALKNHRRIHTEPKRYMCPDCGKAFRVSTQLICHRRVHTKERPFSCLQCGKNFSSKSNLRHHQKAHQSNFDDSMDIGSSNFLSLGLDSLLGE